MTKYHLLKTQLIQYYNLNFCYGYNHDESNYFECIVLFFNI